LKQPVFRTQKSFVRSIDQFCNILNGNNKKVGVLRVLFHLEDLGPNVDLYNDLDYEDPQLEEEGWQDGMADDL
jgi:hypothetical protein